jgi:hypothetical protein
MKTIKVEVKQKHIKNGIPGSACRCPIALAVKDAGLEEPAVICGITFGSIENRIRVPLLKKASAFIDRFDNSQPVKPFSFQLKYEA